MNIIRIIGTLINKILLTIILAPIGLLMSIVLETETIFILLKKIWFKPMEIRNDWVEIKEWWKEKFLNKK